MNLTNIESNFQKVNSMMNKRLIGLLDYLKASVYFSHYNDKNSKNNQENLEKFFKNKILSTNPFSKSKFRANKYSNLSEEKKRNTPLDIVVNVRNNKLVFQKNKYSTPFELHSKMNHFLRNMVVFSKNIHSESKIEKDLKKKYPQIESFSLNKNNIKDISIFPMTPKIKRTNLSIKIDKFTSIKHRNNLTNKISSKKLKNNIRTLFFNNNINNDMDKNILITKNNFEKITKKKVNTISKKDLKNRITKSFRANYYYNKLHLKKLSKNLIKNSYLDNE